MRTSNYDMQATLRDAPEHLTREGERLLARAGYRTRSLNGDILYLPAGWRMLDNLSSLIANSLDGLRGERIGWSTVQQDKNPAQLAETFSAYIRSYKQLPRRFISENLSDHPSKLVMIEFREKGKSPQKADIQAAWVKMLEVLCGEMFSAGEGGATGDGMGKWSSGVAREGGKGYLRCKACGSLIHQRSGAFARDHGAAEGVLPLARVATPGAATITALCDFLDIPAQKTAKAVFFHIDDRDWKRDRLLVALVRGDHQLSIPALMALTGAGSIRPATPDEIRAGGMVPGYGSPIGARGVSVAVDEAVAAAVNLAAGGNQEGWHYLNTNHGRDYSADFIGDIAEAESGMACAQCGGELAAFGYQPLVLHDAGDSLAVLPYTTIEGKREYCAVAIHEVNLDEILLCMAENHHDSSGLILPPPLTPFDVHMVVLPSKIESAKVHQAAMDLLAILENQQYSCYLDDREESAGVKFADADLMGVPLRVTVSERSLASGGYEIKHRGETWRRVVTLEELTQILKNRVNHAINMARMGD